MMKTRILILVIAATLSIQSICWHDATHIAIMQASNTSYSPCLAIAPDVLTRKLPSEAQNHYTAVHGTEVNAQNVFEQIKYYDMANDSTGHLYGAIVAAYRQVVISMLSGNRPDYDYSFVAHYVGDLSQPLHNSPYDSFNKKNHNRIDGIADDVRNLSILISAKMESLHIGSDDELVSTIVNLANDARDADKKLRRTCDMSLDTALTLMGKSSSMLRAIECYLNDIKVGAQIMPM